jgi:membrane-bound serine protease (ClpP class)
MVITSAIGALLIILGLVLFVVDLHVIGHGLLTAGGIVTLLAGGLLLLWAGVPYSGVLLGVLAAVAALMGGMLLGVLGSLRTLGRKPPLTGKEGMVGEVGTVRSPVGLDSEGWVFVHGERWRALLAFVPEDTDPQNHELLVAAGRKVRVVGFDEGGALQVVPTKPPGGNRELDPPG